MRVPSSAQTQWIAGRFRGPAIVAGLITSPAALIVTLAVSAALTAAFGHAPGGPGTLPATVIAQSRPLIASWMLVGLAFGMALVTTVPSIIAYLLLPIAWAGVAGTIHPLSGATVWLDVARSLAPLTLKPLSATQWAHLVTALAIWIGLPLLVVLWRIRRTDLA
jgi:hypothetical protein